MLTSDAWQATQEQFLEDVYQGAQLLRSPLELFAFLQQLATHYPEARGIVITQRREHWIQEFYIYPDGSSFLKIGGAGRISTLTAHQYLLNPAENRTGREMNNLLEVLLQDLLGIETDALEVSLF